MPVNRKLHDLLVIVSLVNLSFLSVWRELTFANPADAYWSPDFTSASYVALLLNVALLSLLLWCLALLVRNSNSRVLGYVGRLGFLVALVFPINYLRMVLGINSKTIYWISDHAMITVPAGLGLCIGIAYLLFVRIALVARLVALLLLVLSPFALLSVSQALWQVVVRLNDRSAVTAAGPGSESGNSIGSHRQRIVWLLFDELDLRLAFTDPPEGLVLPEFKRFRQQAMFALNGLSHSKNTGAAIPSFTTGKLVARATPTAPNVLELELENTEPVKAWSEHPNVFGQARALGARSAIIGLYHPYCRVFTGAYSYCNWYALNTFAPQATNSLFTEMASQLAGITPVFRRINAIKTYRGMLQAAQEVATDPGYDIVYIHVSVPHGPDIYDPQSSGRLTLFNTAKLGYFDNLMLADRFLGELRRSMESAGVWEQSAVLLTADHEWRFVHLYDNQRVPKIPYLLKMPGQKTTVEYKPRFSPMLVTKDLLAIMAGTLTDSEDVIGWLNQRKEATEAASKSF